MRIAETLRPLVRPITSVRFDPKNARRHPERNLDAIRASLKKFGQQKVIVVTHDGVVIAGNGTLRVALELGATEIAASVFDGGPEAWARSFGLADNQTALLAEWDEEELADTLRWLSEQEDIQVDGDEEIDVSLLEATGFTVDEVEAHIRVTGGNNGNCDPDEIPQQVETRCKSGDLWILGNHRLLCGDSTNAEHVERLMSGQKADLWLTDPPYGVSYADKNEFLNALGKPNSVTKRIENDHKGLDELSDFWFHAASNALAACSDRASYYWFACQGGDQMMMMMSVSRAGWKVRHELIWVKNNHVLGRCDYHYKHEPILYGWKADGTHKFYGGFQTSVLDFPKPQASKLHPTMKPIELIERLTTNSARPGDIVLDTFLGSGSTLIACEKTGRRCFGMEIDPAYCDVILARWEAFTGQQAKLESHS